MGIRDLFARRDRASTNTSDASTLSTSPTSDPELTSAPLEVDGVDRKTSVNEDVEKALVDPERADDEKMTPDTDIVEDELLVTWNDANDPENPHNWPKARKWAITLLCSSGGLVVLMSGVMLAPALNSISDDLQTSATIANMAISIFVLAFAFGPMVLAPATEVFGRRKVWFVCASWYVLWSIVCGFAYTQGLMLAARLLAGLGASAEFAVTNPVLSDVWRAEEMGHAFSIATFIPLLGPALGPIIGGFITNSIGWRWIFWVLSIFDGCLILVGFFVFPETYEQLLLQRRADKLREETNRPYHTRWSIHSQPLATKIRNSIFRPCWFLITQPTIQVLSILLAYNFGTLYFVLANFAAVWTDQYHQSISASGLHYLALVIGYTIASQVGSRVTDRVWAHLKSKSPSGVETAPEYRVPLMIPGVILIPTGLLMYGWCAQHHVSWPVVDVGAAIFGCGVIVSTQAQQQYVMACYPGYVASASAASQFLRSIFAFCFPLFAPKLYGNLGYGWGNSVIALGFLVVGGPGPLVLWFYGKRLREKGRKIDW